jgi:hypothetical protein
LTSLDVRQQQQQQDTTTPTMMIIENFTATVETKENFEHDKNNSNFIDLNVEPQQLADETKRLEWIERIFLLVNALVNVSSVVPALTDDGLVTSILSVIKQYNTQPCTATTRSRMQVYNEVLAAEILDVAITNNTAALTYFREQHGAEICFNRLLFELEPFDYSSKKINSVFSSDANNSNNSSSDKKKSNIDSNNVNENNVNATGDEAVVQIPIHVNIMIQELFSLLSSYIQDSRQEASDHHLSQLYKTTYFNKCYQIILTNPLIMKKSILSPAVTLLSEVLNNDTAPPTVLTHYLNNGFALKVLDLLKYKELDLGSELLQSVLNIISGISLTKEGSNLVLTENPFKHIFSLFHHSKYYYPFSRIFMQDIPNLIGIFCLIIS